jgi:hypothetical protein
MFKFPKPYVIVTNPICDNVEKAIIFFRLHSVKANTLPESIVKKPEKSKNIITIFESITSLYIIITTKPAVTRVDLWTKALVGVGALIAFGSHPLKGIWALFVNANTIKTHG